MKKRKLDIFNFCYSIGAVVILIGVIAKFLEWKMQDVLLLTGLSMEALVFTMSSIQFKDEKSKIEYQWERLFPELIDSESSPSSLPGIQDKIRAISERYHAGLTNFVGQFDVLNSSIVQGSTQYQQSLEKMSANLSDSASAFTDFKGSVAKVTASFLELNVISEDIRHLQANLQSMTAVSVISGDKLNIFQQQIDDLNKSIFHFNLLSSGIIAQFQQIGK